MTRATERTPCAASPGLGSVQDNTQRVHILTDDQAEFLNDGHPGLGRHAGVDGGFEHHDGVRAFWNRLKNGASCRLDVGQIGFQVVRDGRGDGDEHHVAVRYSLGGGGGDVPALCSGCGDDVVNVRVAGWVFSGHHHVHGALGDVHAPDVEAGVVEADGCGQTYIAEADYPDGLHL